MKRFLSILLIVGFLLGLTPVFAEEEKRLELSEVRSDMAMAIRTNPVSLPEYLGTQIDWWAEVLVRFLKTAKPVVVFKDKARPGLEITIKEWEKVVLTWGKIYQIEGGELRDQPSFIGIESREIPLLSGLAEIFEKLRLQAVYVDNKFWFGLSYELTEE